MILGAQFYTLRAHTQTEEGIREAFRRVSEIGYSVVQLSAIGKTLSAEYLAGLSKEYSLPVTCTHSPLDRIINDTEALIREHKTYGCTEIGLGCAPGENRGSKENVRRLIAALKEPVEKIRAAGLTFAYHNHAFEFDPIEDTCMFDMLVEETDWNFILDTYWVTYGGRNVADEIRRLQGRILNLHFKDMKEAPQGPICACGNGVIDFAPIIAACDETGVKYGLVEQDNAPDFVTETEDEYTQMAISAKHLLPLIAAAK